MILLLPARRSGVISDSANGKTHHHSKKLSSGHGNQSKKGNKKSKISGDGSAGNIARTILSNLNIFSEWKCKDKSSWRFNILFLLSNNSKNVYNAFVM